MKFISIKSESDIKLEGIHIETEYVDKGLKTVTLSDSKGNIVKFHAGAYDALKATVPAPPTMIKKYAVVGHINNGAIPFRVICENKYEAQEKLDELSRQISDTSDNLLKIEEIEVPEE